MTSFTQVKVILDRLVRGEEIRMHGAFGAARRATSLWS